MSKLLVAILVVSAASSVYADDPPSTQAPAPGDDEMPPVRPTLQVVPREPIVEVPLDTSTPPLSFGRIAGEIGAGTLVGALGAGVGYQIGAGFETCAKEEWFCGFTGGLIGYGIGFALAAPIGVYLVGQAGDQRGSFGATFGGSLVGGLTSVGLFAIGDHYDNDALVGVGASLMLVAPLAGSIIGFNLTRKYDRPARRSRWAPIASSTHESTTFGVVGTF